MKYIKDIVISTSEPPVHNVAWLQPQSNNTYKLFIYGNNGWTPLSSSGNSGSLGGALGGFKYAESVDDIPSTPPASEENIGYVVGTHLYVFVATGGDVKDGKWKDVGEFRGPKGEQGNTGSSVAYPFELVNNLETDDNTKALSAKMGKKLGELISLCGSGKIKGLYDDSPDSIYVTDEEGYVFLKIDKKGLNYVDKGEYPIEGEDGNLVVAKEGKMKSIGMKGHPWFGKNVYCFGDSLMEGWHIQPKLMELTGCKCNKNLNSLVAAGGTWLGSIGGDRGGAQRAQNFVNIDESVYGTKDILLLESVFGGADVSEDGLIDCPPYMFTQYKDYGARTFSSNSEVESFFSSNFSTAISIFDTPKAFSIIRFLLGAVGKKISISGTATANGNVTLTINGYTMSSSVTKGMTSAQIAQKIYEWGFSAYTAWDKLSISSNVITLSYIGGHGGSATDTFSFDGSSVGVTASIADAGTTARYAYMFKSNDISNWNTPSYWSRVSESSDYPNVWKGVIEHIMKNCPQTKIYMCLFPSYKFMESYVRPDGTFDTEAFKRANNSKSRRTLQTALANYYNLPIIDVEKEMNVMNNWHEFYPENNVHPLQSMNDRWAEIIAKHA